MLRLLLILLFVTGALTSCGPRKDTVAELREEVAQRERELRIERSKVTVVKGRLADENFANLHGSMKKMLAESEERVAALEEELKRTRAALQDALDQE